MERTAQLPGTSSWCHAGRRIRRGRKRNVTLARAKGGKEEATESKKDTEEANAFLRAVWYAAEGFGDVLATVQGKKTLDLTDRVSDEPTGALDRREVLRMLRDDYDKSYFISGVGEMAAYDPDCTFADPFVSFKGVDRFKKNVGNLGSLMQDVRLEITDWQEGDESLKSKWRFSCILDLPWRPRLAAAGGTTHVFDERTGKVMEHIEDWDIEPGKVVRDLLRPSSRSPNNRAEAFFLSLSKGDAVGLWKASSKAIAIASLLLTFSSVSLDFFFGGEVRPPLPLLCLGLVAAATEVWNVRRDGDASK